MRKELVSAGLLSLLAFSGCERSTPKERPNTTQPEYSIHSTPKERPYTSQFKYSTQIDPRDFNMERQNSNSQRAGNLTLFGESFIKKPHGFIVNGLPVLSNDLENDFYKMVAMNSQMNELDLKPGQGFRLVGEGKPVPIIMDGMSGLRGGCQFWRYDNQAELLQGRYLDKRCLKLAVASDGTYVYTFSFISRDITDSEFAPSLRVYERFVESFKRPK